MLFFYFLKQSTHGEQTSQGHSHTACSGPQTHLQSYDVYLTNLHEHRHVYLTLSQAVVLLTPPPPSDPSPSAPQSACLLVAVKDCHSPLPPHANVLLPVVPTADRRAQSGSSNHTAVWLLQAEVLLLPWL